MEQLHDVYSTPLCWWFSKLPALKKNSMTLSSGTHGFQSSAAPFVCWRMRSSASWTAASMASLSLPWSNVWASLFLLETATLRSSRRQLVHVLEMNV